MERDDIGLPEQLPQQAEAHIERVLPVFRQPLDVVVDDGHAEGQCQPRGLLADRAEADNAERPAAHFVQARRAVAAPVPGRYGPVLAHKLARGRQRQQDCMLRDSGGIGAAIVAERHARAPGRVEVGLVVARAQKLDQLEVRAGLEQRIVHEPVHEAHEVFGVAHRLQIFGAACRYDCELEAGMVQGEKR